MTLEVVAQNQSALPKKPRCQTVVLSNRGNCTRVLPQGCRGVLQAFWEGLLLCRQGAGAVKMMSF
jgi:hypothetical protein